LSGELFCKDLLSFRELPSSSSGKAPEAGAQYIVGGLWSVVLLLFLVLVARRTVPAEESFAACSNRSARERETERRSCSVDTYGKDSGAERVPILSDVCFEAIFWMESGDEFYRE
jgi:hypothetical protein